MNDVLFTRLRSLLNVSTQLYRVEHQLNRIEDQLELLENATMTTQADLDAVTTSLQDLKTTLVADDGAIQTELAKLQADIEAGNTLDLTGLQAAVSDISSAVDATTALVPAASTGDTPAEGDVPPAGDPGAADGVSTEPTA